MNKIAGVFFTLLGALSLIFSALPAFAVTLGTEVSYEYTSSRNHQTYSNADSQTATSNSITSSVQTGGDVAEWLSNRWLATATSNVNGHLGASAQYWSSLTSNPNTVSAQASWTDTRTNLSGQNQAYAFDFTLSGGKLAFGDWAGSWLNAAYDIHILLNNTPIWESSALFYGSGGYSAQPGVHNFLDTEGTELARHYYNGYTSAPGDMWRVGYTFDTYNGHLDLGTFAPGETFTLSYLMNVDAYGPGYETGAIAQFGDPFNLTDSGFSGSISGDTTSVPEPSTLLLFLSGFAGLVGLRRKIKE